MKIDIRNSKVVQSLYNRDKEGKEDKENNFEILNDTIVLQDEFDKIHQEKNKSKKNIRNVKNFLSAMFIPVLLIAVWQLLSEIGVLNPIILPSPVSAVEGFVDMIKDGSLALDLGISGYRVLVGFSWGCGIGLVLGVASGISNLVERLLAPIIDVMRQIPLYAWIPLFVLWFGIGELSKEVIIAKSVFIPIYINTLQGIRGVSSDYIEVSKVLDLKFTKGLTKVILPAALPFVFTGLRLGAGNAWMAVVAAEMLGGLSGLGYALICAQDFIQPERMIALMAVIGLVGLAVDRVIRLIEKACLQWRNGFSGAGN